MDRTSKAMVFLLGVLLVGLVLNQAFGDHTVDPRTDEQKLEAMRNGVYDSEIVSFATRGYEDEVVNDRIFEPKSPALEYLAYLAEGYAQDLNQVSCQRVRPRQHEVQRLLDRQPGLILTPEQTASLDRIKDALEMAGSKYSGIDACQPKKLDPAQQVST